MDPEPASPTGRPRDAGRERAILDATLAVLADVGYGALTIDAVAALAKASKPTIYRRWAGKPDLVLAAIQADPGAAASAAAHTDDTGSFRSDLLARCRALADMLSGVQGRLILGLAEGSLHDPRLCHEIEQRTAVGLPRAVVDRAVERGELPPGTDPALFPEVAASVLVTRVMAGLPVRDDRYLEHLVDDLLLPTFRHVRAFSPTAAPPPTPAGPRDTE